MRALPRDRAGLPDLATSTHRKVACNACRGDAATLDAGFRLNNLKRVAEHSGGRTLEQLRMRAVDIPAMLRRCPIMSPPGVCRLGNGSARHYLCKGLCESRTESYEDAHRGLPAVPWRTLCGQYSRSGETARSEWAVGTGD